MTIQYTLTGGAINLLAVEDKVERVLRRHEDARGLDKNLIVYLWLEEDGLADILGDESLVESFTQWFIDQATYTESITRARRSIQAEGRYLPESRHLVRRNGRQSQFREHYRRR